MSQTTLTLDGPLLGDFDRGDPRDLDTPLRLVDVDLSQFAGMPEVWLVDDATARDVNHVRLLVTFHTFYINKTLPKTLKPALRCAPHTVAASCQSTF